MREELVDANIFLRYITDDVPEQADRAEQLFQRATDDKPTLITTVMTIAEIVWVLESYYEYPRNFIKSAVKSIVAMPGIEVESTDIILQAIVWYEEKNVDFIDAYHAAWMMKENISEVHTFDVSHLQRFDHLDVVGP